MPAKMQTVLYETLTCEQQGFQKVTQNELEIYIHAGEVAPGVKVTYWEDRRPKFNCQDPQSG